MREARTCSSPFARSVIVLVAALGSIAGCKNEVDGACPQVVGVYLASYRLLDGSCQPTFAATALNVEKTDKNMVTSVQNGLSNAITTEFTFKGCVLGVKQSVEEDGRMVSSIAGDLDVEGEASLSGNMTRTEYAEDGAIACHGVYEAHYTRRDAIIGAATAHAGGQ